MLRFLLTVSIALAAPRLADGVPHPGPPVYVEVDVGEAEVTFKFTGEQYTLNRWFGKADPDTTYADPLPPPDAEWVAAAVRELLERDDPITIDGERREPRIGAIEIPPDEVTGYGVPALTFTLRYPVEEQPRSLGVVWKEWERLMWFDKVKLPIVFRSFGEAQLVFLTPAEPGYTWRPESVVPRERPQVAALEAPPPPTFPLPLVSAAVVAALLCGFPFLVRARVGAMVILALTLSAGVTAWFARHAAVVEVRNPLRPEIEVPDEAEATELFDQLLRNVYAAFDARTEDEIYDLLAVSVAPELLDQMYGEVYESLILRGQGGAVCQIEKVEVLEREVDVDAEYQPWDVVPPEHQDDPFFRARWKWRVYGVVSHWGHEHRRVNSYEASYIVRNDGTGWKIAGCEILDQSRVDSDG